MSATHPGSKPLEIEPHPLYPDPWRILRKWVTLIYTQDTPLFYSRHPQKMVISRLCAAEQGAVNLVKICTPCRTMSPPKARDIMIKCAEWCEQNTAQTENDGEIDPKPTSPQKTLPNHCLLAHRSYEYAVFKIGDVPTDKKVYEWLKENGCDEYEDGKYPSFDSWSKYVRIVRGL